MEEILKPGYYEFRKLHQKVLVVAQVGNNKDWAAYCAAVPGKDAEKEWQDVTCNGDKLSKVIAEAMFPHWAKVLQYRT
jgi:hypothetical protein